MTGNLLLREERLLEKTKLREPIIIAGIPAYNEEYSIAKIVQNTKLFTDEVIVVDDGSTDNTARLAEAAGAVVIRHKDNLGAGAATKTCFDEARIRNADILVTLDGDGQHKADEIPQITTPVVTGEADVVIGSRFLGELGNMPLYRKFGINIITWLFNIGATVTVTDSQCGFRAYGKKAISRLNTDERGFGFSIDLLIQSRENNLVIAEAPTSCKYLPNCHSMNPIMHGFCLVYDVVRLRLVNKLASPKNGCCKSFTEEASLKAKPRLSEHTYTKAKKAIAASLPEYSVSKESIDHKN